MAQKDALDLSAIDPPIWHIKVGDIVYGPYTLGQMRSFAAEDRLRANSNVARAAEGTYSAALAYSDLRVLFDDAETTTATAAAAEVANFLITLRTDADGRRAVIAVLNELGRFSELMSGTFILHAAISAFDLRNQLSTILAERGKFVIVNATTGQLAWMGLGADTDQHARAVWKRRD